MTRQRTKVLKAGGVGYFTASIRDLHDTKAGDTVTHDKNRCDKAIEGFKVVKPMVFSGIFPAYADDFEDLREALSKLVLTTQLLF